MIARPLRSFSRAGAISFEETPLMKAADFDYFCAVSIPEACRLLAGANGEGRIIAGGQTLVPLLAMRLARPSLLVDINRIADLRGITLSDDAVTIKACTTQADALASDVVSKHIPLLAKALGHVGHTQTRNRGTIGGSLANADPVAEICMAALALDGQILSHGPKSKRTIPCSEFFRGAMTTALAFDECLTAVRLPIWGHTGRVGSSFQEMSIRRCDFALVAAAVQASFDDVGICRHIAIVVGGCGPKPMRASAAADRLIGTRIEEPDLAEATRFLQETIAPQSDLHASADYRRRVAGELVTRAVLEARQEAMGAI
jgi:CO/xanthine dehydrogenase FAD-binding subunit